MRGVIPLSKTLDTIGTMARNVADLILLDQIFTNKTIQINAPYSLKGLRIGIPNDSFLFQDLDPETSIVINQALKKLTDSGVNLIKIDASFITNIELVSILPILLYDVFNDFPLWLKKSVKNVTINELINKIASPDVKKAVTDIWKLPTSQKLYTLSLEIRTQLQIKYLNYFNKYHISAMIFPTTPLPARTIKDSVYFIELNGKKHHTATIYTRNTLLGSSVGVPGLSIPIGLTKSGLPVGLEIEGLKNEDMKVLQIGLAFESLFGHLPRPDKIFKNKS
jgi:mandelamide amidase